MFTRVSSVLSAHHEAVIAILRGDDHSLQLSIGKHREALTDMYQLLNLSSGGDEREELSVHQTIPSSPNPAPSCLLISTYELQPPRPNSLFWPRVFKVTVASQDYSLCNISCADQAMVTSVILYNIAVAFHNQGLRAHNDLLIDKAFQLYSRAMSVLRVSVGELDSFNSFAGLLHVSITANTACINATGNQNQTMGLFELINELSIFVRDGAGLGRETAVKLTDLMIGIECNIRSAASAA